MSRERVASVVLLALILYGIYLALAGSLSPTDLVFGAVSAAAVSLLVHDLLIREAGKLSLGRLCSLVKYMLKYFLVYEVKAHLDVARRALSPSMPINPGIVEIPYNLRSEFAVLLVANSITNTPGTVTVAVDEERGKLYVHWIDVKTTEPEECRHAITEEFERYAKRIFD